MSSITVDRGIPVPSPKDTFYPWAQMQHGDSFFIRAEGDDKRAAQRRVYSSGRAWMKRNKPDAKVRMATRIEQAGVRVWMEIASR